MRARPAKSNREFFSMNVDARSQRRMLLIDKNMQQKKTQHELILSSRSLSLSSSISISINSKIKLQKNERNTTIGARARSEDDWRHWFCGVVDNSGNACASIRAYYYMRLTIHYYYISALPLLQSARCRSTQSQRPTTLCVCVRVCVNIECILSVAYRYRQTS